MQTLLQLLYFFAANADLRLVREAEPYKLKT